MSLRFDRVNSQSIQVGDASTFKWMHGAENPTGFKWSVSFWMKLVNPNFNDFQIIFDNHAFRDNDTGVSIAYANGVLGVTRALRLYITRSVINGQVIRVFTPNNVYPNDTNWHHIVVTYDQSLSANNAKFYVDGTLVGQGTKDNGTGASTNSTYVMHFGRSNSESYPYYLDGFLEDLRFYKDRVLTADEVKIIARTKGHDGIVGNLFARYLFKDGYDGEPTGRTVLLLHGYGPDGSKAIKDYAYGNKAVTVVGNACIIEGANKFGGSAIKFDGSSYLTLADSDDWYFGTGDFTIDLWCMFNTTATAQVFCCQRDDTVNNVWYFYKHENGSLIIAAYAPGGVELFTCQSDVYPFVPKRWYHLATVRNGNEIAIFVDGVKIKSITTSNSHCNSVSPLYISKYGSLNWGYIRGYIDEFRITKGAARWASNFTPPYQEYFSEITEISSSKLYTFVSSPSAPRYRGGELVTQRRYRRW